MYTIEHEDYKLFPSGSLGGKTAVCNDRFLGEFDSTVEALAFVQEDMEENLFFPSIWWISDHGNYWMIDKDGNEIPIDDTIDDN